MITNDTFIYSMCRNAEHRPLEGLKTCISSESSVYVGNWGLVLKTAGCTILEKMPTKTSNQSGKFP